MLCIYIVYMWLTDRLAFISGYQLDSRYIAKVILDIKHASCFRGCMWVIHSFFINNGKIRCYSDIRAQVCHSSVSDLDNLILKRVGNKYQLHIFMHYLSFLDHHPMPLSSWLCDVFLIPVNQFLFLNLIFRIFYGKWKMSCLDPTKKTNNSNWKWPITEIQL